MRSLTEYIQFVLESGHAVQATPIPAYITPLVYKEIEDKVHKWNSKINLAPLGSIGEKFDDQFNGDIDIAIDIPNREELLNMVKTVSSIV